MKNKRESERTSQQGEWDLFTNAKAIKIIGNEFKRK